MSQKEKSGISQEQHTCLSHGLQDLYSELISHL